VQDPQTGQVQEPDLDHGVVLEEEGLGGVGESGV
jgi:hypothetical protein